MHRPLSGNVAGNYQGAEDVCADVLRRDGIRHLIIDSSANEGAFHFQCLFESTDLDRWILSHDP